MHIEQNISLRPFNSFGIDVRAEHLVTLYDVAAIPEIRSYFSKSTVSSQPALILGGGSNILLTKDVPGYVLRNCIEGLERLEEDDDKVVLRVGAGMNWHQFVMYCVDNNYGGVENLALIPGNVGASPMQNIGAYGVELKDTFHSLEAYHLHAERMVAFSKSDCGFGYRESVFKSKFKDQFIITSVTFTLSKKPTLNVSYGAIGEQLMKMNVTAPGIRDVALAVMDIRRSKLPDPGIIGNAGSFFKNPVVEGQQFQQLKQENPGIVGYALENGRMKLAAGWLIEACGWKGFRRGNVGCHAKQALVLVNFNNARGQEVLDLANDIIASVAYRFGVTLEREVNVF